MTEEILDDEGNPIEPTEKVENLEEPEKELEEPEVKGTGPEGKKFYTAEELKEAVDTDTLDTSRINPEHEPYYKAFQSDYTKKTMALAQQRKEFEAIQTKETAPTNIEEAYMQDPKGVREKINIQVQKLIAEGEYEKAEQYRNLKETLEEKRQDKERQNTQIQNAILEAEREIYSAIPEYKTRQADLHAFALKSGLTKETIAYITHPAIVGKERAVEVTKAINFLYELANPEKVLKGKEKKVVPLKTEGAGSGGEKTKPNLQELFKKAQEGGTTEDWAEYLTQKKNLGG